MTDLNLIPVPQAVQQTAREALDLHRTLDLPVEQEATGIAVAERIASGAISPEDVASIARFFSINERHYADRLQAGKNPKTDGLCRSWMLRGGEHARVWATRKHADLLREGLVSADPYKSLLVAQPDEVYARFAVGAWRWEYGLDTPQKAAKFYEDYHRATGLILDLNSAFGPSGPAVANAVRRRVHGEDPFKEAKRALQMEDADYRYAASLDLDELRYSLDESIAPQIYNTAPITTAVKMIWPAFVAHIILASERPELLKDLNADTKRPPTLTQDVPSLLPFSDAVRTYLTFFHPKGARYVEPSGTDFDGITQEIEDLMIRAYFGRVILPAKAQKLLGAARRWTAENKLAGSLFHIYNADWRKGNWQRIFDALPLDSDIREPFGKFVAQSPIPALGIKLQQLLTDKKWLKRVADYLQVDDIADLKQLKLDKTALSQNCSAAGTPIGIYSVFKGPFAGEEAILLGAFLHPTNAFHFVFVRESSNTLTSISVGEAYERHAKGTLVPTKANKDMKTGYSVAATGPKAAAMATPKPEDPTVEPPAVTKDASVSHTIDGSSKTVATDSSFTEIEVTTQIQRMCWDAIQDLLTDNWDEIDGEDETGISADQARAIAQLIAIDLKNPGIAVVSLGPNGRKAVARAAQDLENEIDLDAIKAEVKDGFSTGPSKGTVNTAIAMRKAYIAILEKLGEKPLPWTAAAVAGSPKPSPTTVTNAKLTPDPAPTTPTVTPPKVGDLYIDGSSSVEFSAPIKGVLGNFKSAYWVQTVNVISPSEVRVEVVNLRISGTVSAPSKFVTWTKQVDDGLVLLGNFVSPLALRPFFEVKRVIMGVPYSTAATGDELKLVDAKPSWLKAGDQLNDGLVIGLFANADQTLMLAVVYQNGEFFARIVKQTQVSESATTKPQYVAPADASTSPDDLTAWLHLSGTADAQLVASKTTTTDGVTRIFRPVSGYEMQASFAWSKKTPLRELGRFVMLKDDWHIITGYGIVTKKTGSSEEEFGIYLCAPLNGGGVGSKAIPVDVFEDMGVGEEPPMIGDFHEPTLAALLPPPNSKLPKLNYRIGKAMLGLLKDKPDLVLVPQPKNLPFKVGANYQLDNPFGNPFKYRIHGWTLDEGNALRAIAQRADDGGWDMVPIADLKNATRAYDHTTYVGSADLSQITMGRGAGDSVVFIDFSDLGKPVNWPTGGPDANWDQPQPIVEPPMVKPTQGGHIAAGVLALIPAGAHVAAGDKSRVLAKCAVVLRYPFGEYGGYKLAIPKGTVETGESPLKTAVRELYEETGFTVEVLGHLGDFKATTSMVRLYVGRVNGGKHNVPPLGEPEETDAVTLCPLPIGDANDLETSLWYKDLVPQGTNNVWQQAAIKELLKYVESNGLYGATAKPSTDHAQVELVEPPKPTVPVNDTPSPVVSTPVPSAVATPKVLADDDADLWKSFVNDAPFPVTPAMLLAIKKLVKKIDITPTAFNTARDRKVGPNYGEVFFAENDSKAYTASGYVSIVGTDGVSYHYLYGLEPSGLVTLLTCAADGAPQFKTDAVETMAAKVSSPFYTHPDPAINARIIAIYEAGGDLSAGKVSATEFKTKWMKEAQIPYYAVVTKPMVLDVCALFVPGALSNAQATAIIQGLKSRMAMTQSKKAVKPTPVSVSPVAPEASTPAAPLPKSVSFTSAIWSPSVIKTMANPEAATFTDDYSSQTITQSSKPTKIVTDANGNRFFVKWRNNEPFQAATDRAASEIMAAVKGNVIPVTTFNYGGQFCSIQPFFAQAAPPPADPSVLDATKMSELLSQHAVDMFIGDHDGHVGNWVMVGDSLVAVDRGQAFKFLIQGKPENLDPSWHAPGNFGDGYAKKLLLAWAKTKAQIPTQAWAAMRATIASIQSKMTKPFLAVRLEPIFAALKLPEGTKARVLNALDDRRANYLDEWTKVLTKLRADFAWPDAKGGIQIKTGDVPVLEATPEEMKIDSKTAATIKEAVAYGWRGKSLRIDGPWVENQEVMVRKVFWETSPTQRIEATLVHCRLSKNGGVRAVATLQKNGELQVLAGASGPQPLSADTSNNVWGLLFAATKTINYHLIDNPSKGSKADGKPNQNTVNAALALRPKLEQMLIDTQGQTGKYAPTDEPASAVYAMADQYLGYLKMIEYWNTNAASLLQKHTPQIVQFLYEEPDVAAAKPKQAKPFKARLKNQGSSLPTIVNEGSSLVVKNLNKSFYNSSVISQLVIEDPSTGALWHLNPTTSTNGTQTGVQGAKGICWGLIPGAPSESTIARALKLFQEATGVPMAVATEQDQKLLYLFKQAAILQGDTVNPNSDGTILTNPKLTSAMSAYESGDTASPLVALTDFVSQRAGIPEKGLMSIIDSSYSGEHDAAGGGFYRHNRIGWDVARLKSVLGKNTYVTHRTASSMVNFIESVRVNGALLANEVKAFYGVTKEGASPSADYSAGGSQGIFACFRTVKTSFYTNHLYFDLAVALRVDVYIVGTGDTYGNVMKERRMTPDSWASGVDNGSVSSSSGHQISIRHDIDLQTHLVRAGCPSESDRKKCIDLVKSYGWTFKHGTPEEIFVVALHGY